MPRREHNAWSLVFFTTLTQKAVGTFSIWGLSCLLMPSSTFSMDGETHHTVTWVTLVILVLGVFSGGLHLGTPTRAGFVLRNLNSSWLSREAIIGGTFGMLIFILYAVRRLGINTPIIDRLLIISAVVIGLLLDYGISRLYMLRTVPAWNNPGTPAAFFITSILLGLIANAGIWICLSAQNGAFLYAPWADQLIVASSFIIFFLVIIQLIVNILTLIYLHARGGAAAESVQIVWTELRVTLFLRWVTAIGGVGVLVISLVYGLPSTYFFISFGLVLGSEILGRYLFYGFYRREGI